MKAIKWMCLVGIAIVALGLSACQQEKKASVGRLEPTLPDDEQKAPATVKKADTQTSPAADAAPTPPAALPVEPTAPQTPPANAQPAAEAPKLVFKNPVWDVGAVGPGSVHSHDFEFVNEGAGVLKIERFHAPCGCTVPQLDKKEYAPGETGVINVRYTAPQTAVTDNKPIYIFSNDPKTPQYELTVKAKIEVNVKASPQDVVLMLDKENAGMPDIVVESTDGKPFAITGVTATNEIFDIPFDANQKQTKHILKPIVKNKEKLNDFSTGVIQIKTDHPQSGILLVRYTAKPEFELSRPRIILQNVEYGQETTHEVWIRSNYNQKVEIASFESVGGLMTIVGQEPEGNHLKILVKVTAPTEDKAASRRYITDELKLTLKTGQVLSVRCSGWFKLK